MSAEIFCKILNISMYEQERTHHGPVTAYRYLSIKDVDFLALLGINGR